MWVIGVYVVTYSAIIALPMVGLVWLGVETGYKVLFSSLSILWLTAAIALPIVALQG